MSEPQEGCLIPERRYNHFLRAGATSSPDPSSCPYSSECVEGEFYELRVDGVLGSSKSWGVRSMSGSEREERRESMQNFLDGLVRSTRTVMTRAELGGTLFLVAVIGVLLTSREEGGKSD